MEHVLTMANLKLKPSLFMPRPSAYYPDSKVYLWMCFTTPNDLWYPNIKINLNFTPKHTSSQVQPKCRLYIDLWSVQFFHKFMSIEFQDLPGIRSLTSQGLYHHLGLQPL